MQPIMTDLDAAPSKFLKLIRCKCKTSNKAQCATKLCPCRKSGVKCVSAYGKCRGETCKNLDIHFEKYDEHREFA